MTDDLCSICLEELKDNYMVINCNHIFHEKCIHQLTQYNINKCPLCRTVLILPICKLELNKYYAVRYKYTSNIICGKLINAFMVNDSVIYLFSEITYSVYPHPHIVYISSELVDITN